ncbi:hypothetical protein DH86_00001155, partial [Scytalidium sp. 3C]
PVRALVPLTARFPAPSERNEEKKQRKVTGKRTPKEQKPGAGQAREGVKRFASMLGTIIHYSVLVTVWYTLITLGFYMLSFIIPICGFVARLLAAYAALIICALYGSSASIFLRAIGNPRISQWATARSFKYVMWLFTGVTFVVEDPNDYLGKTRPAVFIGNHQTELDVLMLGCMFPKYCSVTAKKSLKNTPFLGCARAAMSGAADEMNREKQSVYMFPEGTRSYAQEPMLLPFKKGAFHLAVQGQVPIVPVVVANYAHILSVKKLRFKSGSIPVKVLKPIETKGLTTADVDKLTTDVRQLMLDEIIALTAKARGEPIAVPAEPKKAK